MKYGLHFGLPFYAIFQKKKSSTPPFLMVLVYGVEKKNSSTHLVVA